MSYHLTHTVGRSIHKKSDRGFGIHTPAPVRRRRLRLLKKTKTRCVSFSPYIEHSIVGRIVCDIKRSHVRRHLHRSGPVRSILGVLESGIGNFPIRIEIGDFTLFAHTNSLIRADTPIRYHLVSIRAGLIDPPSPPALTPRRSRAKRRVSVVREK